GFPGEGSYTTYCATCHGLDRKGSLSQGISDLTTLGSRLSREQVVQTITQGRGMMPSFSFLPERTRRELVDYLLGDDAERSSNRPVVHDDHYQAPVAGATGYYDVPYVSGGE